MIKKIINSADYYATKFFKDKNLKYIGQTDQFGADCPYCGVAMTAVESYHFKDLTSGDEVEVKVSPSYLTCPCCGSC